MLVTNYREGGGGHKTGGGGASEVSPLQKGDGKSFSHAEWGGGGGGEFEVVLTGELEVLANFLLCFFFHLHYLVMGLKYSFPIYSQTAILHAAHFRRVVKLGPK